jgi:NIPSNAP
MKRRTMLQAIPAAAVISFALVAEPNPNSDAVYELRVYHIAPGRQDDLLRRFREHTMALFEKHGIHNVAYWLPTGEPLKGHTLIYMLRHPSREAADVNWKAFREDPEWVRVKAESEANGPLVEKIDSTFLSLTDFSPQLS